jgi:hypothetical protein
MNKKHILYVGLNVIMLGLFLLSQQQINAMEKPTRALGQEATPGDVAIAKRNNFFDETSLFEGSINKFYQPEDLIIYKDKNANSRYGKIISYNSRMLCFLLQTEKLENIDIHGIVGKLPPLATSIPPSTQAQFITTAQSTTTNLEMEIKSTEMKWLYDGIYKDNRLDESCLQTLNDNLV